MYEEYINQLHIEAKLRNLADSSIKTYTDFILRFLEYTGKAPQDISAEDVRNFLLFKQELSLPQHLITTILPFISFSAEFYISLGMMISFLA